jgi:O-antigen/teichoic acid export membrane protein
MSPATFGVVSLTVGISTLALNTVSMPFMQAIIHLYPEMKHQSRLAALQRALILVLRQLIPWVLLAVTAGGALYCLVGRGSPIVVALLVLLLAADVWRSVNLNFLNAARQHRKYSVWVTSEAWGRPLLAAIAVVLKGESPVWVLSGYLAASGMLFLLFTPGLWHDDASGETVTRHDDAAAAELSGRIWRYALPLIPVGIVDWTNGLSDRYVVGGLLGVAHAGIYAAAYGLASRPFLMMAGTIELVARPIYQKAVSQGQHQRASRLLSLWLAILCGAGIIAVGAMIRWRESIVELLLGESFHDAADLLPWIAAGYALFAISCVFERVCYAYGKTYRVLTIQVCTALIGVLVTLLGTLHWGLIGTAAAVSVYFAFQLLISIVLAHRTYSEALA